MRRTLALTAVLLVSVPAFGAEPAWMAIAPDGAPVGREQTVSVWTGRELIVWGGVRDAGDHYTYLGDGGRLDPATGVWRALPTEGAPSARGWHSAVWTGSEMIVWGGSTSEAMFADGAAYAPATDTWRPVATEGAPLPRVEHAAVWTGTEMLVIAGVQDERSFTGGGRYDPATDTWRPLSAAPFLIGSRGAGLVWTGTEAVLFGGINGSRTLRQGGRYDPATDAWRPMSLDGAPSARGHPGVVWTGSQVVVFGGSEGIHDGPGAEGGALYDPAADAWAALPTRGRPAARTGHALIWTGEEVLVWGGGDCRRDAHRPRVDAGARWRPGETAWRPLPTADAPTPRAHCVAHAADGALVVWGGVDGIAPRRDGALLRLR